MVNEDYQMILEEVLSYQKNPQTSNNFKSLKNGDLLIRRDAKELNCLANAGLVKCGWNNSMCEEDVGIITFNILDWYQNNGEIKKIQSDWHYSLDMFNLYNTYVVDLI